MTGSRKGPIHLKLLENNVYVCLFVVLGGEESTTCISFPKGLIILLMVKYLMTWKDAAMYLFYIITENNSFQR